MRVASQAKAQQAKIISPFEVIPPQTQRLTQFDEYRKAHDLVDSLLNFDGEDLSPFAHFEEDFLTDSLVQLDVPSSLIADIYDEDEDIASNAIEETRIYLADSYLDELEPSDLIDHIGNNNTNAVLGEVGEALLADDDYMADWYVKFDKGACNEKRYGDDGKKLKGHKTNITIGKDPKTGKKVTKEACVYDRGGEPSHAEEGHKRGKSSPTRHHKKKGNPQYVKTILKATKADLADSMHKRKGVKIGKNGHCSSHQEIKYIRDENGHKKKVCRAKEEYKGKTMSGRSPLQGKKRPTSAILKAQKTRAKHEAMGD